MTSSTGGLVIRTRKFLLRLVRSSFQKVFPVCKLPPAVAVVVAVAVTLQAAAVAGVAQLTISSASLCLSRLARRSRLRLVRRALLARSETAAETADSVVSRAVQRRLSLLLAVLAAQRALRQTAGLVAAVEV